MSKTLAEQYNDFKNQVQELREKLKETGEKFLIENFKNVFNKYPQLSSVKWTAYTPWFNDGEPCTYSSNHDWADLEFKDGNHNTECEDEIKAFLDQFDNDLMLDIFGDHVEIEITAEGISINEYEHD